MNRWLLLLGIILVGCHEKPTYQERTFPVKVASVSQDDIPRFLKGIGQLVASLEVEVKPQVKGTLTNVLFEDGQLVDEGDLLATVDPRLYEAALQRAEATLARSRAQLRYALDFAETYGQLVGNEYVSRLDYEQGVQNVGVYKAQIEDSLAEIQGAKVELGFTEVRAPTKGYVGLRNFDPGNYVDPLHEDTIVSLRKISPLTVSFSLPSYTVETIRKGQKKRPLYLEAYRPNMPADPLIGELYFIDNEVSDETGMIHLKGIIPNEDERGWPGEFVRVFLRVETLENALLVPTNSLVLGQDGYFVFVLNEETMEVEMKMVGKGIAYHDKTVVEWGVKKGEIVVTDGQLNLFPNAKVKVIKEKA